MESSHRPFYDGKYVSHQRAVYGDLPSEWCGKISIEKYNGYCEKGVDEEFAKGAEYLFALESGPYYAFELKTGIFASVGGLKITTDAQVLDEHKNPVPHLYAVGNDAGGLYGDSYDVSICEGSCQGFAVFSGKAAAEHIAANA